jgi:NRAMP (natural resistance-associated macrophage protein)-like metal ion transporter
VSPSTQDRIEAGKTKRRFWRALGPGLITGAADDDPSGIATYSQAGAQFGFALGWSLVITFPLMVAVQSISARIGRTTGRGLAGNLRAHYSGWILQSIVAFLFAANVCNIGADLGAMSEATRLLLPGAPAWTLLLAFSLISTAGQVFFKHARYVAVLKWLTLSLFSYFAVLMMVHIPVATLLRGLFLPELRRERAFWLMLVAIFGTTISPYLFFWQAAQEVEDTRAKPSRTPLREDPGQGESALARIQLDTLVGMGVSNAVALAILITTAVTLHAAGVHHIETAAQAAEALRPVAGPFAFALFALGIVGTGLLSVSVLAGSAAYALGEARRWPVGLSKRPTRAPGFYITMATATLVGAVLNATSIKPVQALVWSAVLNALVAVPTMTLLMRMGTSEKIMGRFLVQGWTRRLGWLSVAVMALASLVFLASLAHAPGE